MRAIRIFAVLCLVGYAMTAQTSIKQKLAEKGNSLAQVDSEAGNIGCTGCGCCTPPCGPNLLPFKRLPDLNPAPC